MMDALTRVFRDIFFPPTCSGCGERGTWLCARCADSWPSSESLPGMCRRCGEPTYRSQCGCRYLHPRVVIARSAFPYGGWVRAALHGVKYEGEKDRAHFLGSVLSASTTAPLFLSADLIVPVPMHRRRQRERGYNQAELIADGACAELGIGPPSRLLEQQEERLSQVGLGGHERRMNVRGAFSTVSEGISLTGTRIVLVDDVRTTGATLSACVAALGNSRPARIDIVTFAKELTPEVAEHVSLSRYQ